MKFINLIVLMALLSIAFANHTRKHKRPVFEYEEPEYEETSDTVVEDNLGIDKMKPVGDRKCKCLKFCQGICMQAECCETFKAKCRHVKKYPTLTKPK